MDLATYYSLLKQQLWSAFANVDGVFDGLNIPNQQGLESSQLQDGLSFVFVLLGITAVIVIIIAGWRYVLFGGDPAKTKQSKDTILWAVIGLVVSVSAWVIVNFVLDRV